MVLRSTTEALAQLCLLLFYSKGKDMKISLDVHQCINDEDEVHTLKEMFFIHKNWKYGNFQENKGLWKLFDDTG